MQALNASIYAEPPPVIIDARNRTEICRDGMVNKFSSITYTYIRVQ